MPEHIPLEVRRKAVMKQRAADFDRAILLNDIADVMLHIVVPFLSGLATCFAIASLW